VKSPAVKAGLFLFQMKSDNGRQNFSGIMMSVEARQKSSKSENKES